jgi:NAD-dependent dihydropyrimidine dehydrogenase PreA subunit
MRDFHTFFNSIFKKLLNKFSFLGKLIASLFGLLELPILELGRRIARKSDISAMEFLDSHFLRGRWGGRIIPLNENIDVSTKFAPTQEIVEIVSRSNVAKVSYCYCRTVQRTYNEPNCDHPLYTCIHLSYGKDLKEIAGKNKNFRNITKQEAIDLLEECDKRGLVHQLIYFPSPDFYYVICNCCPCCCIVLNNFIKESLPKVVKSDVIARTELNVCQNCGSCVEWCYFGARNLKNGKLHFDDKNCFGCGICISKCQYDEIKLELRKTS